LKPEGSDIGPMWFNWALDLVLPDGMIAHETNLIVRSLSQEDSGGR